VLFDWDGTLADSAAASFRAYVALFEAFGIVYGVEDFARTYSPDWYRTYEAMKLARENWDAADALFLDLYAKDTADLLPDAASSLRRLQDAGLRLALVSSGTRSRVEKDLARLGVASAFDAVVCGGDTVERKPAPEPLFLGLDRLSVPAGSAAYVGDSPEDIQMARAAGVYAIAIPGGFPNREALLAAGPDLVAPSLDEAVNALVG
jgi:HAD superfamily hydrolase (TIGR01549 family)